MLTYATLRLLADPPTGGQHPLQCSLLTHLQWHWGAPCQCTALGVLVQPPKHSTDASCLEERAQGRIPSQGGMSMVLHKRGQ